MYFSGQGKVAFSNRDSAGNSSSFRYLGNCPSLSLDIETDIFEHKESTTGQRAIDLTIVNEKTVSGTLVLEDFDLDNLAIAFAGTNNLVAADTGVLQVFEDADVVLDRPLALDNPHEITNVVVKDSTDVTTYVLNTDYTVDATYGTITPLSTGSMPAGDGPRVTYDHSAYREVRAFNSTSTVGILRLEGINTVSGEQPIILQIYKCEFQPVQGAEYITEEGIASLELSFTALADDTKADSNKFFKHVLLADGS